MSQTGKHWQNELNKSGFAAEALTTGRPEGRRAHHSTLTIIVSQARDRDASVNSINGPLCSKPEISPNSLKEFLGSTNSG